MFRPANNRAVIAALLLAAALASGCGQKSVRLTLPELRELETCVIQADDQVERQNCVERLFPKGER